MGRLATRLIRVGLPFLLAAVLNARAHASCGDWLQHGDVVSLRIVSDVIFGLHNLTSRTTGMPSRLYSARLYADPLRVPRPCTGPQCGRAPIQETPNVPVRTWDWLERLYGLIPSRDTLMGGLRLWWPSSEQTIYHGVTTEPPDPPPRVSHL
jgi:hypothetical protein